jgi:hypothetical protein
MKQAFEQEDYKGLKKLAEASKDKEAQLYLGIIAENGLDGPINLEEAEEFYKKSFDDGNGNSQAGIGLARIYQKDNKFEEAKKVYKKIIKSTDVISKQYATYRLARLDEKELLGNAKFNKKEADRIIGEYRKFLKNSGIAIDSSIRTKVMHHQLLIETRSAEEELAILEAKKETEIAQKIEKYKERLLQKALSEDTPLAKKYKNLQKEYSDLNEEFENLGHYAGDIKPEINRIEERQSNIKNLILRELSKTIQQEEERLRDAADLQEESGLKDAKEALEVISKRYAPAAAELTNIEARQALREKKYEDTAKKVAKALQKDPNNLNALSIQLEANHAQVTDGDEKQKTALFESARELLKRDVFNEKALKIRDDLKEQLVKSIITALAENLKDQTKKMDGYVIGTSKDSRESYIDKVIIEVEKSIKKSKFLEKYASFEETSEIVRTLSGKILAGKGKENLEDAIKNNKTPIKKEVKEYIAGQLKEWDESKVLYRETGLYPEESQLLDNRKLFKKKLKELLSDYNIRCLGLSKDGSDLTVKDSDLAGMFDLVGEGALVAFAAARNPQGMAAGAAIQAGGDLYEQARKALIKKAAEDFCAISERDHIKADKAFDRVADRIVERYGMQIDNIERESLEGLAKVAAEKMLYRFREVSVVNSFSTAVWDTIKNPLESLSNAIKHYAGIQREEAPNENALFQGIEFGKAKSQDVEINVKNARDEKWNAEEVFERPAITSNGRDFYERASNIKWYQVWKSKKAVDANKYGAMYIPEEDMEIGGKCKKTSVSGNDSQIIAKEFDQHLVLTNNKAWISSEKKDENKKVEILQSEDGDRDKKDLARTKRWKGILKAVAGVFTIGAAKIVAAAVLVGTMASGVGIPIAVAAGIIGFTGLISGAKDYGAASKELKNIKRREVDRNNAIIDGKAITQEQYAKQIKSEQEQRSQVFKKIKSNDIFKAIPSKNAKQKGFLEMLGITKKDDSTKTKPVKKEVKEKWEDLASKAADKEKNKAAQASFPIKGA